MSKIVGDVKSGIKAVRGAGDTIRGTAMEVTDQALDSNSQQLKPPRYRSVASQEPFNHGEGKAGHEDCR